MARRLGQRDITYLSVLAGLFLLLAVLVLYGSQGYDHPFSNVFLKILGIPGTSLGWGSVALVLLAIPYALLAWLRGPIPAKAVSLLGGPWCSRWASAGSRARCPRRRSPAAGVSRGPWRRC